MKICVTLRSNGLFITDRISQFLNYDKSLIEVVFNGK